MKKITLLLALLFMLAGCSENSLEVKEESKLVVNASFEQEHFIDQFSKPHAIQSQTQILIFAFSKDVGHACNEYFASKPKDFLETNKALFFADVSAAPSLIRSMFILPGLRDFEHTVLVIEDEEQSLRYKPLDVNEKIVVVRLNNFVVSEIAMVPSVEDLNKYFH